MKKPEQMALIMSIVERGSGGKLVKLYKKNQVFTHIRFEGQGTATSEILDILGLGGSEKDILLSVTTRTAARVLLERLDDELRGAAPGRGIAFAMPLTAVSNLMAAYIGLKTKLDSEGSGTMDNQQKTSMILVTVNQGYTDAVMDTARKAGARGGTIIRGRWAGDESFAESYGITTLQEEKELIFIVVPAELRNSIMDAVTKSHGLRTEAGAMVSSVAVEQLVHLS
ncbi:MAG: hypothetical protein K2O84_06790 [Oscillospiraceae bacterium]|jgi:hypothetical protein|nr:hypothetical protein [Oscillospiraceae bacterium]